MQIHLITVGLLKKGPERDLISFYDKQIKWAVTETQIDARRYPSQKDWQSEIDRHLSDGGMSIFMDEKGKNLTSRDFADTFEKWQLNGQSKINIVIGGADGFSKDFKKKADMLLSFGQMTWPHMLARAMLYEQIYRAQQILANHPYHRD